MIVITGSTGHVGGEAARLLAAQGHPLRLLVRNPSKAPALKGAQAVAGEYGDSDSLARALRPGDSVFMVSMHVAHDERLRLHRIFVEAAARAKVAHLVYLSFLNASHDSVFVHSQSHASTEDMIKASGLPYTFVRTSLYTNVIGEFHIDGLMRAPGGAGRVSWVTREDCGAAVAGVLGSRGHEGKTYNATGPEALSLAESSAKVREVLGHPYRYEDSDDTSLLTKAGIPDWAIPIRRTCFQAIARGELATVGDALPLLAGRPATSVASYIASHPQLFPAPGA
jgi:NAD(P)H dehydrogenase (quinone)